MSKCFYICFFLIFVKSILQNSYFFYGAKYHSDKVDKARKSVLEEILGLAVIADGNFSVASQTEDSAANLDEIVENMTTNAVELDRLC